MGSLGFRLQGLKLSAAAVTPSLRVIPKNNANLQTRAETPYDPAE